MRFRMRIDPWWLPFLLPLGVRRSTAYVVVDATTVRLRFGLFRYRIARSCVVQTRPVDGRGLWWWGIGVHTNFVSTLAINGSLAGMVELRLEPPQTLRVLLPVRCSRLYLSLEDRAGFLKALDQRPTVRAGARASNQRRRTATGAGSR